MLSLFLFSVSCFLAFVSKFQGNRFAGEMIKVIVIRELRAIIEDMGARGVSTCLPGLHRWKETAAWGRGIGDTGWTGRRPCRPGNVSCVPPNLRGSHPPPLPLSQVWGPRHVSWFLPQDEEPHDGSSFVSCLPTELLSPLSS